MAKTGVIGQQGVPLCFREMGLKPQRTHDAGCSEPEQASNFTRGRRQVHDTTKSESIRPQDEAVNCSE